MKLLKIIASVLALGLMLVIGFFLMPTVSILAGAIDQPAFIDGIDQPVFMDGNLVLADADIAQPITDENRLTVAPAMTSHLKYTGYTFNLPKELYDEPGRVHNKGGFQSIEIIRLTEFRGSSKTVRTGIWV